MARQKEFDQNRVLDKAIDLFWNKGYEATSMQDLVEQMGVNRQSLYDTFGDKRALFLAALQRYRETNGAHAIEVLQQPGSAKGAIRQVLESAVQQARDEQTRRGCFMANTMVELAPHDIQVARCVTENQDALHSALYQALLRAQAVGEIGQQHNLDNSAWYLVTTLHGLQVMSKAKTDPAVLQNVVEVALAALS